MSTLNVIIIDDEKGSRELLNTLLENYCDNVNVLGMGESVDSGLNLINSSKPDLIFLDIEMPGGDGFTLLESLSDSSFDTCFVTGYKKYALKAIKHGCLDYLLKPVEISELKNVVTKAKEAKIKKQINKKESLVINEGHKFTVVDIEDIICISTDNNYATIYLKSETILSSDSLSNLMESLIKNYPENCPFVRTHKSHIINLNHIQNFENGRTIIVNMSNNVNIPVAARRKKEFIEAFENRSK